MRYLILSLALSASLALAQAPKSAPAKAKDPVCGMEVDTKTSEKATYKGSTYYFCSRAERESFEKTPEKFLAAKKK